MLKTKLKISDLTPGMKLGENITNELGVTLMPMGIRLTPMFISRLAKWNVESVMVLVEDQEEDEEKQLQPSNKKNSTNPLVAAKVDTSVEQQEFIKEVSQEVGIWFSDIKDHPLMMQLRSIALKKLVADGRRGRLRALRHVLGEEPGDNA